MLLSTIFELYRGDQQSLRNVLRPQANWHGPVKHENSQAQILFCSPEKK
jgi:hypothetical protein